MITKRLSFSIEPNEYVDYIDHGSIVYNYSVDVSSNLNGYPQKIGVFEIKFGRDHPHIEFKDSDYFFVITNPSRTNSIGARYNDHVRQFLIDNGLAKQVYNSTYVYILKGLR